MMDYTQLNGLALAYVGDAAYEIYIREYLINSGQTKPSQLHRTATKYVSAKAQAFLMQCLLEENWLTEQEQTIYKRGRNAKSHTSAKNADVITYRISTGFEALIGYLHLTKQSQRVAEIMAWAVEKVRENNEKK